MSKGFRNTQEVFQGYIDHCMSEGRSLDTIQSYAIYLDRFSDYLHHRGVKHIRELDKDAILGFTNTFTNYSPAVIHTTLCSLRAFFHYLFQKGFVAEDFAYVVPRDGDRSRAKIPSAYSKEDVEKLLNSIDRGNPNGKRDYAMIVLAARLGFRAQDICDLASENSSWETKTFSSYTKKLNNH